MKLIHNCLLLLAVLAASTAFAQTPVYDVVIYGGTSAGVTAAVEAAKHGKSVIIVCPDVHLGGLSSAGLGQTDSGNKAVIGGLSREFYHRLWLHYAKPESWTWEPARDVAGGNGGRGFDFNTQTAWNFEPSVAEAVFEQFIKENNVPVVRNQYLDRSGKTTGVIKEGNKIVAIETTTGYQNNPDDPKSGTVKNVFYGKIFIDATYEGDLMAQAGVSWTVGREPNSLYNETLNGVETRCAKYHQFKYGIDPYVKPGKPESGLLPMINQTVEKDGSGDKMIQAYCYRLCMTQVPENRVPFIKPDNYDPLNYELYLRALEGGETNLMNPSPMPNYKTDTNNSGPFSHDFIGQNHNYIDASDAERVVICKAHEDWQQGLMWTLQHNPRVPEAVQKRYANWGLAKDEFTDTRHFGHKIYVREGRRMVSDFVHTENHCRQILPTPCPVGYGSYNMDSHHCQRHLFIDQDGKAMVRNEGDVQVHPGAPYPIDYGTLVPKRKECSNLFVPVCVSCSHIAFGSIRMEPVFMILGQSAGAAAAIAIDDKCDVQDVSYQKLRPILEEEGQVLEYESHVGKTYSKKWFPGIVLDNLDATLTGDWKLNNVTRPFIETNYLHDDNANKGKCVATFKTDLPKAGKYEVLVAYTINANRATNVPVTVKFAGGQKTVIVNQKQSPTRDNIFLPIGVYQFDKTAEVQISNEGTNGHVIVDAVQFVEK
ncbi:MAG: FAD-dependent oxidoreductase [Thermoguttaceae bacterium]|nr:FAD-dependent oxidoreductase [Thermoguttaceae bacterium]MBQ6615193.1 FAD-dependent oxidoreductase [Thermoguttaceae bacterium]